MTQCPSEYSSLEDLKPIIASVQQKTPSEYAVEAMARNYRRMWLDACEQIARMRSHNRLLMQMQRESL